MTLDRVLPFSFLAALAFSRDVAISSAIVSPSCHLLHLNTPGLPLPLTFDQRPASLVLETRRIIAQANRGNRHAGYLVRAKKPSNTAQRRRKETWMSSWVSFSRKAQPFPFQLPIQDAPAHSWTMKTHKLDLSLVSAYTSARE